MATPQRLSKFALGRVKALGRSKYNKPIEFEPQLDGEIEEYSESDDSESGQDVYVSDDEWSHSRISHNVNKKEYIESDSESQLDQNENARFQWQSMLTNVLSGDVLRSEKTRLSSSLINQEYSSDLKTFRKQLAYNVWFLLRVHVHGSTPEEENKYLEEARAKVDDVINELSSFKVIPLDNPIDPVDQIYNARDQVTSLLKRIDWCESLYPSTRAMEVDKERMQDPAIVARLEALRTWMSLVARIGVKMQILKKFTGDDWDMLTTLGTSEASPTTTASFIERITREDKLEQTIEQTFLSDLHKLVLNAKDSSTFQMEEWDAMCLPLNTSDLDRLAFFPSRIVQEVLRFRLRSNPTVPDIKNVVLIDELADIFRNTLAIACIIKRQYIEIATPHAATRWRLPPRIAEYEQCLTEGLTYFLKLLHLKLLSPHRAIYLKETDIIEQYWAFLSTFAEEIEGGDVKIGESIASSTSRLFHRALNYFETQLKVLETRNMSTQETYKWFNGTLDNVRMRNRKLLRFAKNLLYRFEYSVEYSLDDIHLRTFLTALQDSGHFMVYTGTYEKDGMYVIGDPSLTENPALVYQLLSRCFHSRTPLNPYTSEELTSRLHTLESSERTESGPARPSSNIDLGLGESGDLDDVFHYVLLITPREPFLWAGRVMNLDVNVPLELKDSRLRFIADGPGSRLGKARKAFIEAFPALKRSSLVESKSHFPTVARDMRKLRKAIFRIADTIISSVGRVKAVSRRISGEGQEILAAYFSFAADLGQQSTKLLEPQTRPKYKTILRNLGISWIAFICDDCVPTDPRTFKWAVPALEFAMRETRGDDILHYTPEEFALLRMKVASCMTLLISHFDILGARSSNEARKQHGSVDIALMAMKKKLDYKLRSLKIPGNYDEAEDDWEIKSIDSLDALCDRRIEALRKLDVMRQEIEAETLQVGRVLDREKFQDRTLANLASSLSNISVRWKQGKFIGSGTFGQVYLAVNLDTGTEMAVKEIRFQDLTTAPHLVSTIRDEMSVMELLEHPNIVEYYGIEVHRDRVYIFEEYCAGGSLAQLLDHGKIEEEIILQVYALQLMCGLTYLHSEKIVHRDIKPENILLTHDGQLKYVDFGAAKDLAKNSKTLATRTRLGGDAAPEANSLTGTPMYLSPETVKGEQKGKLGAMDVWALGCVILECATGRKPWSNLDNEWAIMFHIGIAVQHPPLPEPGELSPEGIDFIRQCLTIDAEQRPTVAELLNHPWIVRANMEVEALTESEEGGLMDWNMATAGLMGISNILNETILEEDEGDM